MSRRTAESELKWWTSGANNEYFDRDAGRPGDVHKAFFEAILSDREIRSAVEIGCATGTNLVALADRVPRLMGIDPSLHALKLARSRTGAVLARGSVYDIPLRSGSVDLLLTYGMLIHIPERAIVGALQELVRIGARYVLLAEYMSDMSPGAVTVLPANGNGCWPRPYGRLFVAAAGGGYLEVASGHGPGDGISYCLFERI